jgi:hypothetical protein
LNPFEIWRGLKIAVHCCSPSNLIKAWENLQGRMGENPQI